MLFKNILIVCIGNICRSPMAEALFKEELAARQASCIVTSAGLGALVGYPADEKSCHLMLSERNINISSHRAQQIDKAMIRKADLVLAMEARHKTSIEELEPSAKGKVFRLGHWGDFEIPDPYRKDIAAFESSFKLIEKGVSEWMGKI